MPLAKYTLSKVGVPSSSGPMTTSRRTSTRAMTGVRAAVEKLSVRRLCASQTPIARPKPMAATSAVPKRPWRSRKGLSGASKSSRFEVHRPTSRAAPPPRRAPIEARITVEFTLLSRSMTTVFYHDQVQIPKRSGTVTVSSRLIEHGRLDASHLTVFCGINDVLCHIKTNNNIMPLGIWGDHFSKLNFHQKDLK